MARLYIPMPQEQFEKLREIAVREVRTPQAQALVILRDALEETRAEQIEPARAAK
jgi:hypothetical protein